MMRTAWVQPLDPERTNWRLTLLDPGCDLLTGVITCEAEHLPWSVAHHLCRLGLRVGEVGSRLKDGGWIVACEEDR